GSAAVEGCRGEREWQQTMFALGLLVGQSPTEAAEAADAIAVARRQTADTFRAPAEIVPIIGPRQPAPLRPPLPRTAAEPFVTARKAAAFLGYAPKTVLNKYRDRTLPGYKLDNGSVRFLLSELGQAMKSNAAQEVE